MDGCSKGKMEILSFVWLKKGEKPRIIIEQREEDIKNGRKRKKKGV